MHDVEKCIEKITTLNFSQEMAIFSSIKITPVASGFCLGSANWLIQTHYEKIVWMGESSLGWSGHPMAMEIDRLETADILIITNISSTPSNPDNIITDLANHIGATTSGGGNVLLPCEPSGVAILDLIEVLHNYLSGMGLPKVPIYFISPVAEASIAYSNIVAEWSAM